MMGMEVDLVVRHGDFRLDAVFTVQSTGVTVLFGASGCGKTSLLRAIAGLDRHKGVIRFGETLWQDKNTFIPAYQRGIGYVFQEASLFEHLDVLGNIAYGAKRMAKGRGRLSLPKVIELLGLEGLVERSVEQLSGGERQRVAIARAIAMNPRVLLMDEPLASLDRARKHQLLPYFDRLRKELGLPIIYVSHSMDEVARLADRIVLIKNGGVRAEGGESDIHGRNNLYEEFNDQPETILERVVLG